MREKADLFIKFLRALRYVVNREGEETTEDTRFFSTPVGDRKDGVVRRHYAIICCLHGSLNRYGYFPD